MAVSRKRGSAIVAMLCIALGTAAVSAVLTLVDATLLQPLPFPEADRLVRIWNAEPDGDPRIDLSLPEVAELDGSLRGVDAFVATARSRIVARLPGGTERLRGEAIDRGYLELLGLQPALGRAFADEDHRADAVPTLLLSHALWTGRFGADAAVLGTTLEAGEHRFRIVGVLPRGFAGTIESDVIDFWIPRAHYQPAALREERGARLAWTLARLAPGSTLAALQSELDASHVRRRALFPRQYAASALRVEPFGENWRAPLRGNAALLLAAVFVLLAIAVSNVAALLLARALDRRRELALRCALGANRWRIARELVYETGRLALAGGVLGALAAPALLRGLLAVSPLQLPAYLGLQLDFRGALLVAASLAITALAAALLPAWFGSGVAPQAVLAGGTRSSTSHRDRRVWTWLIGGEIAMSFALLVLGALLLRSYVGLADIDLGFRRDAMLRMAVSLAPADSGGPERLPALQQRIRDELARQPGVRAVGLVAPTLPPWDAHRPLLTHAALAPSAPDGIRVGAHAIDTGLLEALGVPLLAGRGIGAGDDAASAPVALVSAALAQRLGGDRALGGEITLADARPGRPAGRYRIVGIAGDVAWDGVAEQDTGRFIRYGANDDARGARHDVYLALAQRQESVVSIAVHAAVPPETLVEPLRRVLARIAPSSAVHWVSTMDDELSGEYAASRFYLTLVSVFGIAALLLAAVGLFALLSHALLARQREVGIRLALGADGARVARLVLGSAARLLGAGLLAGTLLALVASRAFAPALYQVAGFDALAYGGAAALLALVTAVACAWPLRRALALSPTLALRPD